MLIKHHFFGKDCLINRELSDRKHLIQKLTNKGFKHHHILFLNQIHSDQIVVIDDEKKIHGEQNLPKADAIVTNLSHVVIGIVTADCSPILLFDEEKKIIAAVHAGWRGAKSGVIKSTIAAMKKLGAQKIQAIIGPMIQQKSYEVSQEFLDEFLLERKENKIFFKKGLFPDKYWFDLPSYVIEKLHESEVKEIQNLGIDTYEKEEHFFSFRRSCHKGEKDCGRNVSVIEIC